jgi:hypothetical protein
MKYLPLLLLLACTPSQESLKSADYGTFPENYEELVAAFIDETFRDPASVADLEIQEPVKYWSKRFAGTTFGYAIYFTCNAKNGYGGYTGKRLYKILTRNGVFVGNVSSD